MGQDNKTNTLDKIFYNNQEISEDNEKAKVCNEHFIAVGQNPNPEDIPSTDESPTANYPYQNENVIKRLLEHNQ